MKYTIHQQQWKHRHRNESSVEPFRMTLSGGLKATHTNSQELGAAWKKTPKGRTVTQATKVRTKQPLLNFSSVREQYQSCTKLCVLYYSIIIIKLINRIMIQLYMYQTQQPIMQKTKSSQLNPFSCTGKPDQTPATEHQG